MAAYKYINKSNTPVTIGSHEFTGYSELVFSSTQADLDLQDGILVDAYIDGVPKQLEYTPGKLAGPVGIGTDSVATTHLNLPASTTAKASLSIAHGVAPTSPVDGDMWTTTAGLLIRINGVTKTVTFV